MYPDLLEGEIEVIDKDKGTDVLDVIEPGLGSWLRPVYHPDVFFDQCKHGSVVYKCSSKSGCRTVSFDRKILVDYIMQNPRLTEAAKKVELDDLWGKLHRAGPHRRRQTYQAMLQMAVSDGKLDKKEVELLVLFRMRNGITQKQHEEALKKLGLTDSEFMKGEVGNANLSGSCSDSFSTSPSSTSSVFDAAASDAVATQR
uniref:Uncharacterized protein n=1 Tax=Lotharella globosa TaxID=91324 RepID=A0A7S3YH20_9EUKA